MAPSNGAPQRRGVEVNRRRFIGGVGVGLAGAASGVVLSDVEAMAEAVEGPVVTAAPDPRFSRMFDLPAFADMRSAAVRAAMTEIGRPGGLMDARDPLNEGPTRLITNPELSPRNLDQSVQNMTAGTTFVGQFLDHDITFDSTSALGVPTEPTATRNTRDPRIDLDSVYAGGPQVNPQVYQSNDRAKMRVETGGLFEDLPRNSDRTGVIGDPRNDVNVMISGLHAAFLLAHNRAVDLRRAAG
jgi:hypothetical protein